VIARIAPFHGTRLRRGIRWPLEADPFVATVALLLPALLVAVPAAAAAAGARKIQGTITDK